jgi:heptosyltransferase III
MRILFIKLQHIGDALMMTPTFVAVRRAYPNALLWAVVRRGSEGILGGCPEIDRVLVSEAPEAEQRSWKTRWHELKLIRELRQQGFDYALDLGNNDRGHWLAWLSGARVCVADVGSRPPGRWWRGKFKWFDMPTGMREQIHRAEKDFLTAQSAFRLNGSPGPLKFDSARTSPFLTPAPARPYVILHPCTRWDRKKWPEDRWQRVAAYLRDCGYQVVVSTGPDPDEVAVADRLTAAVGKDSFSTQGRANWSQMAWLLYRARLFVGVDTAATHLAAACQCPVVALFGPSIPSCWHPWQVVHRLLVPSPEAKMAQGLESPNASGTKLMEAIRSEEVIDACAALLQTTQQRNDVFKSTSLSLAGSLPQD